MDVSVRTRKDRDASLVSRPLPGPVRTSALMKLVRFVLYLVPVLLLASAGAQTAPPKPPKFANPPRLHAVSLGAVRKVPYTPADVTPDEKNEDTTTLKVRPLIVDERQREWTTGEMHEVTDRTFAIRRAMHLNDSLSSDREPRWVWQPGPWLLVDRVTGRITALHLPDFDFAVSDVVWFRDYAAYCGTATTGKGGLFAIVAQIGGHRAVVSKPLGPWPQPNHFLPVCKPAAWQRLPLRVSIQPTGGEALTFDVVGTTSLVEEGEEAGDP